VRAKGASVKHTMMPQASASKLLLDDKKGNHPEGDIDPRTFSLDISRSSPLLDRAQSWLSYLSLLRGRKRDELEMASGLTRSRDRPCVVDADEVLARLAKSEEHMVSMEEMRRVKGSVLRLER
jgi:hypothetical protein